MDFSNVLKKYSFLEAASETAERLGVQVYIVGGFIRDLILKRKANEMDFLVIGDGPGFATEFAGKLGINNVIIYKNFGTAHFKFRKFDLEFVGARKESYRKESRNPHIKPGTFEEDISRRDFTINTLAVSVNKKDFGELRDFYNGAADIEKKLIKTPLNAELTFSDDPLRILRAFRFASELNFHVDEDVLIAAKKLKSRIEILSQERITDEFLKILASPKPSIGLILLYKTRTLEIIFREIANLGGVEQINEYHHKDVFFHTCKVVDKVAEAIDEALCGRNQG